MTLASIAAFFVTLGTIISSIPWMTLALVGFVSVMAIGLMKYHRRDDNRYDLWDTLMSKGKADLTKHIIVAFAALTIWTIVVMVQRDANVETLLLGALGIFVAQRMINGVADTMKGVPPDEPMQDEIKTDSEGFASKRQAPETEREGEEDGSRR